VAAFDLYPLEAIDTKSRWLEEAARGQWLCGFGHEPEVAFARIKQEGQSFLASPCAEVDIGQAGMPVLP